MRIKIVLVLSFVFSSMAIFGQKYTISGTIRDAANGEELIGAAIFLKSDPSVGTTTNEYGFYSLTLPAGKQALATSYVGYQEWTKEFTLENDIKIDINLSFGSLIEEIVVSATKQNDNITQAQMGVERLDVKEISKLPVLFGERDILKTFQLLPGVKSAGEGSSGFFVRGGSADQNLILLDESPVYNASHLLGFFSTFNSDAIKDATLIKGNAPAQYGGRLASIMDVKMKEGNDKEHQVSGGIGLIASRIAIEGPIQKEKSSFIITGRRTYADVFLKLTDDFKDNKLYFYDLNAKANYRLNENNRLFVSGYFGRDVLGFGDNFGIDWGNKTGTIRWNSIINPKLFSNTSLIYSDYNYNIKINGGENQFNINSMIRDLNLKQEFQFFPNTKNLWKFGFNSVYHTLIPSRFQGGNDQVSYNQEKDTRYGWENAIFANNTYTMNKKLSIDYGLRISSYSVLGSGSFNIYDGDQITEVKTLSSGEFGKTYVNLEPRLSAAFQLDESQSFKIAAGRNTQHLHLLSNSTTSSPTDQWIGNSFNVKPEISDQASVGYFRNFADNNYQFSAESYYKNMSNQVDYKNGADINTVQDVESELLYGKGRAYGLELYLKKKQGRFTGWISYTLSRTERQIEGINNGNWYAARQDRTHDVSIVGNYQLSQNWSLAGVFVFYTGSAVTFPSGKYNIDGNTTFLYTERNGYRMPDYHRLDLSLTYEKKKQGRYQSSWNFGLYNVYGRENAYTITFQDNPDDPSRTQAVQTALFKFVPSITYNFKY